MAIIPIHSTATSRAHAQVHTSLHFPPLELENRPAVPTEQAAHYLNRRPQTLRCWAMQDGAGPIRPLRINGRLAWPVAAIKSLLGVAK